MGRIKSTMVKKAAKQFLERENAFSQDFHHNKKLLAANMPSKPIRNKIAGYISRLIRMKSKPVKIKPQVIEGEEEARPRREKFERFDRY